MTTRPIAIVLLTTLIAGLPETAAERKRKRRVAEDDQANKVDADDQDGFEATAVLETKLDDLIEVAVRLAPELARSKNDRLTARGEAQAARGNQQWGVTLKGQYERFATSPDANVGAFQIAAEDKLAASLGLSRNLPTGGNVGFEIGIIRTIREFEIPAGLGSSANQTGVPEGLDNGTTINDTIPLLQSQVKMTLTQPLARKFGRDVALAQETKGDLAATDATVKTQLVAEEMVRDIVIGYWELAYAAYEVDTRAEALALAKDHEKNVRNEIRAKIAPDNALSQVQFEIMTRQEALLTAQSQWEKKSLELRKKVGLELDRRDLVMRPRDPFEAATDEWDVNDVLKRARRSNRRLASLILQKRIADVDVKVAKNNMLPAVDLSVSGALIGSGNTTDAALGATANSNGYQVMAGLTVNFDIGGAAKGQHDAARARRQRLEVDQADVQRALDVDVVHAVNQVKAARARVALAEQAIRMGEENLKTERSNYNSQRGGATNYTIVQRHTELVDARLRRGRAIADYHLAVAQVQFHGGMLLEQYRVNVRPLARGR